MSYIIAEHVPSIRRAVEARNYMEDVVEKVTLPDPRRIRLEGLAQRAAIVYTTLPDPDDVWALMVTLCRRAVHKVVYYPEHRPAPRSYICLDDPDKEDIELNRYCIRYEAPDANVELLCPPSVERVDRSLIRNPLDTVVKFGITMKHTSRFIVRPFLAAIKEEPSTSTPAAAIAHKTRDSWRSNVDKIFRNQRRGGGRYRGGYSDFTSVEESLRYEAGLVPTAARYGYSSRSVN